MRHWILICLPILFLLSCKDGEGRLHSECDFDIGNFRLLTSSKSFTPYNDKSGIWFRDSLNAMMRLEINELEETTYDGVMYIYDGWPPTDTTKYCYNHEEKRFILFNDSLGIKLSPVVSADASREEPAQGIMADIFEIWYTNLKTAPTSGTLSFRRAVDYRTWPNTYTPNDLYPTYTLFGSTFTDVERTTVNPNFSRVLYNLTEGIVSFKDNEGKRWVYDRIE